MKCSIYIYRGREEGKEIHMIGPPGLQNRSSTQYRFSNVSVVEPLWSRGRVMLSAVMFEKFSRGAV